MLAAGGTNRLKWKIAVSKTMRNVVAGYIEPLSGSRRLRCKRGQTKAQQYRRHAGDRQTVLTNA